jgi:hypothetical protein
VRSVAAWTPPAGTLAGAPDVRFLPPLVRRRCDDLTRAMLHAAQACASPEALAACACVFASRHGSLTALVELLDSLVAAKPLSPNTFSHSVHNAPAGVFSVWAQNRGACSSVAAGRETFVTALVESLGLLAREPARDVLLVCGDEFALAPFAAEIGADAPTRAVALLLGASGEGAALSLALERADGETGSAADPDELAFAAWWASTAQSLALVHGERRWTLTRG